MSRSAITDSLLEDIADAIREKTGSSAQMTPAQMAAAIRGIATGYTTEQILNHQAPVGDIVFDPSYTGGLSPYQLAYNSEITSVTITGTDFVELGNYCFRQAMAMTDFICSATCSANDGLFYDCENLVSVDAPGLYSSDEEDYMARSLFAYCSKLTTLNLPRLDYIGDYCFDNCSRLASLCIKGYMIRQRAFRNCSSLIELAIKNTSASALMDISAFDGTPFASGGTGGTIYVPRNLIETYKTKNNWSTLYGYGHTTFSAIEDSQYA